MKQNSIIPALVDLLNRFIVNNDNCAEILLDCENDFLAELSLADRQTYLDSGINWHDFVDVYVDKAATDSFDSFLSPSNQPGSSPRFFRKMVATGQVMVIVNGELKTLSSPEDVFAFVEEDAEAEVCFPTTGRVRKHEVS